jgi:hypothetical protein
MRTLVFLLEERSAAEMLKVILPRILPSDIETFFITFEGKNDLENNVERKIRCWCQPDSCFVVMRDQDSGDCRQIKGQLLRKCANTRKQDDVLVRIACHELESFYLGDLLAVEKAYGLHLPSQQNRKYREPDKLSNAADELKKLTKQKYQKIDGSRRIAEYLQLDGSNCSTSFNMLISGIKRLVAKW